MMTNTKEILKYGFQYEVKKDQIWIKLGAPSLR